MNYFKLYCEIIKDLKNLYDLYDYSSDKFGSFNGLDKKETKGWIDCLKSVMKDIDFIIKRYEDNCMYMDYKTYVESEKNT